MVDIVRGVLLGLHLLTLAGLLVLAAGVLARPSGRFAALSRVAAIVMGLSGLALVGTLAALGEPLNVVLIAVVLVASVMATRARQDPSDATRSPLQQHPRWSWCCRPGGAVR